MQEASHVLDGSETRTAPCPQSAGRRPARCREEMLVVVHGFSAQVVAGLVRAGLATVVTETKKAPRGLTITVERMRITDDGKKAIEG